jgi:hypothetical protein
MYCGYCGKGTKGIKTNLIAGGVPDSNKTLFYHPKCKETVDTEERKRQQFDVFYGNKPDTNKPETMVFL